MPAVAILIVGAGPAGCVAAAWAKRAAPELDVVVLERDRAVGTPVRCAEGVGDAGLREFANPEGAPWVARKISRVIFIAPNDSEVRVAERESDRRNAREYLDAWLARRYPRGACAGYTVGGVIVHTTVTQTYTDGVLVAGDAAHMINPLSGGGIVNAMKAGRLAGCTAAAAIRAGDTSARRLAAYHHAWMELLGLDHLKYYRIKRALEDLDDEFFNALANHPQRIPVAARFFM